MIFLASGSLADSYYIFITCNQDISDSNLIMSEPSRVCVKFPFAIVILGLGRLNTTIFLCGFSSGALHIR